MTKNGAYKSELPCFLSIKELASMLQVSLPTARNLMQTEGFPGLQISKKKIVVNIDEFKKWVKDQSGQQKKS